MKTIELLSPARDLQCGIAAVECGADAVYMGGPRFGARHAAGNSVDDIARMVDYARPLGVKVYATLNTLVYEDELAEAEAVAREVVSAGVDALIVQDMAFMRMGLEGVEMHASTQAANISPQHVRFLGQAGFDRVILERGLTLGQIKDIRAATGADLEFFVHGAICVGYSGICYFSRSMGPRSGNRGDCSQPCRLSYDLEDSRGETLVRSKHLLSVKDLDLSEQVGDLLDAGITSFKIEGRLKSESYVRNITLYYSRLLDKEIGRRKGVRRSSPAHVEGGFDADPGKSFSRGRTVWMLGGKRAGVASPDTPKAAGSYVGEVEDVGNGGFRIKKKHDLAAGDGICFISDGKLKGTNVNRVENGIVYPDKTEGIAPGVKVFRNFDRLFENMVASSRCKRVVDAEMAFEVTSGGLSLSAKDTEGVNATLHISGDYEAAAKPEKMEETLRIQLSKSGDTIFRITRVGIRKSDDTAMPFIPVSELNALRREILSMLHGERVRVAYERREKASVKEAMTIDVSGVQALNVTNSLAEKFYRDRGFTEIQKGYDPAGPPAGATVMTTPYCLRRELGWCLKEKGGRGVEGPLFLRRGRMRYRLDFDCGNCLMKIINERE